MSSATEIFGPYALLRRMHSGGQADLYLARAAADALANSQTAQHQLVVIKRIRRSSLHDDSARTLLRNEGEILSSIRHAGIVQLLQKGEIDQQPFLCLEYVDGDNLATLLRAQGTLPAALALWISREICCSLETLHELVDARGQPMQLVHRDISPGNVIVARDGRVMLCDLGNAHWKHRERQTQSYQVRGTARYLSPEQVLGDQVDASTDLYALGLLLYLMLSGKHYNQGCSEAEILRSAAQPQWQAPQLRQAPLPGLLELLQRALRAQPERRFASAALMKQAITDILRQAPPINGQRALASMLY